jgi:hypothetical protein
VVAIPTARDLLDHGLVACPDTLAEVHEGLSGSGGRDSMRYIEVRMYGGLHFRLLSDRGLDVSSAWYGCIPLAWHSRVGETPPLPVPRDDDWLKAFGGGLVVTCGMQNVGASSEGHGVHGGFSHQVAHELRWQRELRGSDLEIEISGVISEIDALGVQLRCQRRITTRTGTAKIVIRDTVTNLGAQSTPAPWLYHVNLGAPLWSGDALLQIPSQARLPRDDVSASASSNWSTPMLDAPDCSEMVLEHVLDEETPGRARIANPGLGVELTVEWDRSTLPRLHQWIHRAKSIGALAIEPANCSVLGRGADRSAGRMPVLAPGEARSTSLSVTVASIEAG